MSLIPSMVLAAALAAAAVVDVRSRRLPNPLAAAMAVAACGCVLASAGPASLAANALAAAAIGCVLVAVELAWRRAVGRPGQGMGDVKALCALALASPVRALAAYALALALLAAACLARRERALPLLPFLFTGWVATGVAAAVL